MSRNETLAADIDHGGDRAAPERKCVISGVHGAREALIRLAIDAGGVVHPDLAAKAPGRGAWLVPDRALIAGAVAKGRLRGSLMRAFKTTAVTVPDDLVETIAAGLERRAMDRLGLENRAGHLIWGHDRIGDALNAGRTRLLLHAADAAADGMAKLDRIARAAGVATVVLPADRARLSLALGRDNVVHAAICDGAAAARMTVAVGRWRAFNGLISDGGGATSAAGFTG